MAVRAITTIETETAKPSEYLQVKNKPDLVYIFAILCFGPCYQETTENEVFNKDIALLNRNFVPC